jgi:hypothetical protein
MHYICPRPLPFHLQKAASYGSLPALSLSPPACCKTNLLQHNLWSSKSNLQHSKLPDLHKSSVGSHHKARKQTPDTLTHPSLPRAVTAPKPKPEQQIKNTLSVPIVPSSVELAHFSLKIPLKTTSTVPSTTNTISQQQ